MHIKHMISQHRRDFRAVFKCEHCEFEEERSGYDDTYFHQKVIPTIKCLQCGKTADIEKFRAMATKYPDGAEL